MLKTHSQLWAYGKFLKIIYIPQLLSALNFVNYCTGQSHKPFTVAHTEDSTHL